MNQWQTQIENVPDREKIQTLMEREHFAARRRPVYPRLTLLDDGRETGETIRLRRSTLTIGRAECDLSFSAEGLMSRTHAEISYKEVEQGHYEWILEDRDSRNGTFVRLTQFPLLPGFEFIMGGTKLLVHGESLGFHGACGLPESVVPFVASQNQLSRKAVLELRSYMFSQPPMHIPLQRNAIELGSRGVGADGFAADIFIEPKHATVQRVGREGWSLIDKSSLNGIWLRIRKIVLQNDLSFLIGEQRFKFDV